MALLDPPLGDRRTPDQRRAARVAAGIVDTVGMLATRFVSGTRQTWQWRASVAGSIWSMSRSSIRLVRLMTG